MPIPLDRIRGALLGTFVGDAAGRPFEGSNPGPQHDKAVAARLAAAGEKWTYTDDTETTISLAESIAEKGGFDVEHAAHTLATRFDASRGYSRGTEVTLIEIAKGEPYARASRVFRREGSRGNGAAARVAAVACRYADDREALRKHAVASAAITHAHPEAIAACLMQATAIAFALAQPAGEPIDDGALLDELDEATLGSRTLVTKLDVIEDLLDGNRDVLAAGRELGNGVLAIDSVPLAIYALIRHGADFQAGLTAALRCAGDTDTVAAMAGALLGAAAGAAAIPPAWLANLEDGPRGRSHVDALAAKIAG